MTESATPATVATGVTLACVELSKFRRLARVRLNVDPTTTILVGANNSGKTSILLAIRKFLSDKPGFKSFDLSLSQWSGLRELSLQWEALAENPVTEAAKGDDWDSQLQKFLDCMPMVDLWFDAQEGSYNYVAPFITSLMWSGGPVGVRLRLEPASSVEELQHLAWRYREARQPVRTLEKSANAWPMDLLDYWLRHPGELQSVAAYKLDPAKGPLSAVPPAEPQQLPQSSSPVDLAYVNRLVRVDFIPAQRGLGTEDDASRADSDTHRIGLFSNQLLKFARQHLNVTTTGQGHRADLIQAIATAQTELDKKIRDALDPSVQDVKILGYPGLYDPQEIHFRTRIQTADLLDHSTAVQYQLDKESADDFLPEYSIGLGYQNLQSLSYQLVSFKASRLTPPKGSPAAVHLVMVEEPEAHLHVQVQRIFPDKAHKLISPTSEEHSGLNSQLLISTHSSHLAHAQNFDRLRYVRRVAKQPLCGMPSTKIINLGDVFGTDNETRLFAERYFRVQHTDMLFADASIFVEGTAERMLIPLFIERDFPELSERYVSFLDIGGSHAHRLKPLVEKLGIPTVVITDIDPVLKTKAVHIDDQPGLECGNDTLTGWHPKLTTIADFKNLKEEQFVWSEKPDLKVRFAWQLPIDVAGGRWPSSFEDSLILSNLKWFETLGEEQDKNPEKSKPKKKLTGTLAKAVSLVKAHPDHKDLSRELHEMLRENFSKGDFAATLFERINAGAAIDCPTYISTALTWLQGHLSPTGKELP